MSGRRSFPSNDAPPSIEDMLKLSGYSYNPVEITTLPTDGIKRRDNEPSLLSRHIYSEVLSTIYAFYRLYIHLK